MRRSIATSVRSYMTNLTIEPPSNNQLEHLRWENALFRRALEGVPIIVFSQDRDLRYTWVHNPMLGFSPESIIGKNGADISSPEDNAVLTPIKQRVLATGIPIRQEVALKPNGVPTYYDLSLDPLFDDCGQVIGLAGLAIDITERKRLLENAEQGRQEVETALNLRDQFFAVAAHELKNPLTTLIGRADLLLHQASRDLSLNEAITRTAKEIKHQAQRLNGLIDSLLDITRVRSGTLSIQLRRVDVRALVERLVEETHDLLAANYDFQFDGPPDPVMIMGDEERLEQVFNNLIGNAVKYSPSGGTINVRVECVDKWVHIAVADQGIGIPEAAQAFLFQQFYRAPNASASGMGIGLFVAKEILVQHGGDITVVSKENDGSTFIMRLPLANADPA
jgi:PAS domain S-box-containing protein